MPRTPRTPRQVTGTSHRLTDSVRGKTMVYLGAGLALAAAGTATATAGFSASTSASPRYDSAAGAVHHAAVHQGNLAGQHGQRGTDSPARSRHTTDHAAHQAARQHAASHHVATHDAARVAHRRHAHTWAAISRIVANRTTPRAGHGPLPAADLLTPVGTSGPQAWMPITPARWDNARTIIRQAIGKRMGLRAAVIAVATAMQESTLENISYGTYDSLGLFQQRPSAGWGTPSQILHPKYAADAFLNALRGYQARNPYWAHQPLWQAAQGVQDSAFPYAYAKWEAQAATLVASITKHLF
jgi:hypothetical protein